MAWQEKVDVKFTHDKPVKIACEFWRRHAQGSTASSLDKPEWIFEELKRDGVKKVIREP